MARSVAESAPAKVSQTNQGLDIILEEMVRLQTSITELSQQYEALKKVAFPLVEVAGGVYKVNGIKAQIIRSQTWEVDAVQLLKKFKEKVHDLLTVSTTKFRKAIELNLLGTPADLKGIAQLVDETPKFRLS